MVEILLLIGFITCFTAPLFIITICQWLDYKKVKKAKIQTDYEDELSLCIGTVCVILFTGAILTVIGVERCHKFLITRHSFCFFEYG